MVKVIQRGDMFVGVDDSHLPLLVSTFRGSLDLDAVRWHDQETTRVIDACLTSGRRALQIVDARDVNVPSAQLRKYWADRIAQSVRTLDSMLGVFVVIDRPILRGVLTAINWICHEARRVEYFSTLDDAVNLVNIRFAAAGYQPVTIDTASYGVASDVPAPKQSYQAPKGTRPTSISAPKLAKH